MKVYYRRNTIGKEVLEIRFLAHVSKREMVEDDFPAKIGEYVKELARVIQGDVRREEEFLRQWTRSWRSACS